MSEFFEIDNWDETEQIEYFENPIYSYLNEDEKNILNAIHPDIKKRDKKYLNGRNNEGTGIKSLINQIQRKLHVSTPDGEPEKFSLLEKKEIPPNFPVDKKFLKFYRTLFYDTYYVQELRDLYNKFFKCNLTMKGIGHVNEIKLMFSRKRKMIYHKRRIIYSKIYK